MCDRRMRNLLLDNGSIEDAARKTSVPDHKTDVHSLEMESTLSQKKRMMVSYAVATAWVRRTSL